MGKGDIPLTLFSFHMSRAVAAVVYKKYKNILGPPTDKTSFKEYILTQSSFRSNPLVPINCYSSTELHLNGYVDGDFSLFLLESNSDNPSGFSRVFTTISPIFLDPRTSKSWISELINFASNTIGFRLALLCLIVPKHFDAKGS